MRNVVYTRIAVGGLLIFAACCSTVAAWAGQAAAAPQEPLTLWYRQAARQAGEALPIGNGRLGALVWGGVDSELLQLTETTFWSGSPSSSLAEPPVPRSPTAGPPPNSPPPDLTDYLADAQKMVLNQQFALADRLIARRLVGSPDRPATIQPAGSLALQFPGSGTVSDYRRELNLDTAVAKVAYTRNGVRFSREIFASPADGLIVLRLSADRPGQITLTAGFLAPQRTPRMEVREGPQSVTPGVEGPDTLVLRAVSGPNTAAAPGGLKLEDRARILPQGGKMSATKLTVTVTGADSVVIFLDAGTSFKNYRDITGEAGAGPRARIAAAAARPYAELVQRHVAEHQRLFRRVALELGDGAAPARPTDERVQLYGAGVGDPQLAALYYQFGRYLLLSCSRPGGQLVAGEGLWKDSVTPGWASKTPPNLGAAYWPAESGALPECVEPLQALVRDLTVTGARAAQSYYGAAGWMSFQQSDLWRNPLPLAGPEGFSPVMGAWLAGQVWERALFSGNRQFVTDFYPVMKSAAEFYLATLRLQHFSLTNQHVVSPSAAALSGDVVEGQIHQISTTEADWLVTVPSTSPGQSHPPDPSFASAGPTFDNLVLRELFFQTAQAAGMLERDAELKARLEEAGRRLPPFAIGKSGQLQPWIEDWTPTTRGGATAPLWPLAGVFPGGQISPRRTPELAAAARASLEAHPADETAGARGWRMNLWARLGFGDRAHKTLSDLLAPAGTGPNLLSARPPFQLAGNLAAAGAIAEMLLQSHDGEISFLPALPAAWPDGAVRGLRARGGFEVEFTWRKGALTEAVVISRLGGTCKVRAGTRTAEFATTPGKTYRLNGQLVLGES